MDEARLNQLELRAQMASGVAKDIRELEATPPSSSKLRFSFRNSVNSADLYNAPLASLIFALGWHEAKKVKEAELEKLLASDAELPPVVPSEADWERRFDELFFQDTDNGTGPLWLFRRWPDGTSSIALPDHVKGFIRDELARLSRSTPPAE